MKTGGYNKAIDTKQAADGEREALSSKLARIKKDALDLDRAAEALTEQISDYKKAGNPTIDLVLARDRLLVKAEKLKKEKLAAETQIHKIDFQIK